MAQVGGVSCIGSGPFLDFWCRPDQVDGGPQSPVLTSQAKFCSGMLADQLVKASHSNPNGSGGGFGPADLRSVGRDQLHSWMLQCTWSNICKVDILRAARFYPSLIFFFYSW